MAISSFLFFEKYDILGLQNQQNEKIFGSHFYFYEYWKFFSSQRWKKTHENWETIEWNSLKKVKIFWILYLDDSSRQEDI